MHDRRRGAARRGSAARARAAEREVRHLGPIPITPTGVVLAVAVVLSLAYLAYAISVRDASQLPLLASGAVVLAIVFAAVALVSLVSTWRSSVEGRDGRAFGHALVGGVAALIAFGCLAGSLILGFLAQPPG